MTVSTITVSADGTSKSIPVTVQPTAGVLTFNGSPASPAPWRQAGGGPQAANWGLVSKTPRYRGNMYFSTPQTSSAGPVPASQPQGGVPCIQFQLPQNPNIAGYDAEASTLNYGPHPYVLRDVNPGPGDEEWIGISVWVPPGGMVIPNLGWFGKGPPEVDIGEYHMPPGGQISAGQPSLKFSLLQDQVQLTMCTGRFDPTKMYEFGANGWGQKLPAMHIIPPGGLVSGSWNSMIVHVIWAATSAAGFLESWYRSSGGAWQPGFTTTSLPSPIATVSTLLDGTIPSSWTDNGLEAYGGMMTQTFNLYHAGEWHGTSFAVVANQLP